MIEKLNKEQILEAGSWTAKKIKLEAELKALTASCKHWSLGPTYEESHRDANFPDKKMADCEFCGTAIRL